MSGLFNSRPCLSRGLVESQQMCVVCVIAESKFDAAQCSDDDDDDDDDADVDCRVVGLPSGVYGRGVHSKHYTSFTSFDNVSDTHCQSIHT